MSGIPRRMALTHLTGNPTSPGERSYPICGRHVFCLAPRPLLPLQNWVFKVLEVITGSGSRSRKKCANQIKDQCLISKNEFPSTLRRSSKNNISYLEGRGAVKQKIFEYFQNDPSSVRFKRPIKLLKKRRFESEDFSKIFLFEGRKWIEQKGYILCSHADCVPKNFNKRVSFEIKYIFTK